MYLREIRISQVIKSSFHPNHSTTHLSISVKQSTNWWCLQKDSRYTELSSTLVFLIKKDCTRLVFKQQAQGNTHGKAKQPCHLTDGLNLGSVIELKPVFKYTLHIARVDHGTTAVWHLNQRPGRVNDYQVCRWHQPRDSSWYVRDCPSEGPWQAGGMKQWGPYEIH